MHKIHISKFITRYQGSWPTHASLGARCGRSLPEQFTNRRSRATCKACLKARA